MDLARIAPAGEGKLGTSVWATALAEKIYSL
jgi:hypothetical protein